ncbi:50S ribosomal protein L5 [Desulfurispirillum indicum]|uniref:Large ribosomal subunit protein uL5 n=1 Tax=Desulfurispirillum indicum (strain ATCC BAA-1389 / DSM 22839 / S5) TaxID=653733 RepID=E6W722_DESIS|nr:50S ribosomal protein L5 [Desulfurispirillum indicum]ADU65100.1 50S ribosomal protein L5 [Desulfurispirillum indicum S5]UCZ57004.1 50S ribosomal protein L5 [Desulfurispirillum indicum]
MSGLKEKFQQETIPALMKEFSYKNVNQVPKLEKIVVNMGLGEAVQNAKIIEFAEQELIAITGQKPLLCRAKKSVATFRLREGMPIGLKVTLRGQRMYEFLNRLVNIALPRVRDLKPLSEKSFDGRGNYSLGVKEQIIFPEITYDKIDKLRGMDITLVTTAKTDEEGRALLREMGLPFKK